MTLSRVLQQELQQFAEKQTPYQLRWALDDLIEVYDSRILAYVIPRFRGSLQEARQVAVILNRIHLAEAML